MPGPAQDPRHPDNELSDAELTRAAEAEANELLQRARRAIAPFVPVAIAIGADAESEGDDYAVATAAALLAILCRIDLFAEEISTQLAAATSGGLLGLLGGGRR